jgi:DNA-nicking Smr family endonuclease
MNDEGVRGRRSGRRLSAAERALWKSVTDSAKPLRGRARPVAEAAEPPPPDPTPVPAKKHEPPAPASRREPARPPAPPPLAQLGRRERSRVARGTVEIDARIDLHGMTQERAHNALLRFIRSAQADGAKLTLVITGKGTRAAAEGREGRGVLRRLVPEWLSLPEFRAYVVGFEAAHITHGGEGALYVRVRRGR